MRVRRQATVTVVEPFTYTMPAPCRRGAACEGWRHVRAAEGADELFLVEPCCGKTQEEAQAAHDRVCCCARFAEDAKTRRAAKR